MKMRCYDKDDRIKAEGAWMKATWVKVWVEMVGIKL